MNGYKTTIGIEVHAELNTKSKMFCGCANDPHASEPNTNICAVCLAHPGTLPRVNEEAVKKVAMLGTAINGEVADFSEFDRKQYFYPDIPKAYQLSQYQHPFVKGGEIKGVAITRVHLEEDTAKSQHLNANDSLVDFNRAGVPLMELVTEPVIHDSKTAVTFAKELQLILRKLGISNANMEKGEMRVEANISISNSEKLGTKVEVKNLNSFRAMEKAIEYEVSRQAEILAQNGYIKQETRGWDENKGKTFSQRSKETAEDYRYFPDPDIPKYKLSEVKSLNSNELRAMLPVLPEVTRQELASYGLNSNQIEALLENDELSDFFAASFPKESTENELIKLGANYLVADVLGLIEGKGLKIQLENAFAYRKLIEMAKKGEITSRVAKDMLEEVVFEGKDPAELASSRGLKQENSADKLKEVALEVIKVNEAVAADFKAGKESALQYLVGQGMKATKGSANPTMLAETIRNLLQ